MELIHRYTPHQLDSASPEELRAIVEQLYMRHDEMLTHIGKLQQGRYDRMGIQFHPPAGRPRNSPWVREAV